MPGNSLQRTSFPVVYLDQFLFLGNRARYGSLEHKLLPELDPPQASLIYLFQARHPLRAPVTSAFPQLSSVSISRSRGTDWARFLFIALGCESSSNRTLSSSVNLLIFRGGVGGKTIKVHSPSEKLQEQVKLLSKVNFAHILRIWGYVRIFVRIQSPRWNKKTIFCSYLTPSSPLCKSRSRVYQLAENRYLELLLVCCCCFFNTLHTWRGGWVGRVSTPVKKG